MEERKVEYGKDMKNMEETQVNSEIFWKIKKKIQGKYGKKIT